MKIKLVTDCSANICENINEEISYVPLKIITDEKEYTDDCSLDTEKMLKELKSYKGRSRTACPSTVEWLESFDDADIVLGAALTSGLSGCYNSALIAVEEYYENNPTKKVYIHDSLTTGPELELLMERYDESIKKGLSFEEIVQDIKMYSARTHLTFSLESVDNFAKNGRVSPLVAKAVGIMGIRIIGIVSQEGTLEPLHKVRGEKKSILQIYETMLDYGFNGGKVRLSHTFNEPGAKALAEIIKADFPDCDIHITPNRGLCCYYAEEGSVLAGFEGE